MTHEFKSILLHFIEAKKTGINAVLASLVYLEGSSYRKPGVRMLLLENGTMVGAISGGCVEKEIQRQSLSVFKSGTSKLMIYDGRYRLGCEGKLFILLEFFNPSQGTITQFNNSVAKRTSFNIHSFFNLNEGEQLTSGSKITFDSENWKYLNSEKKLIDENFNVFKQEFSPSFRLVIIGSEHDAVILTQLATFIGWEVVIITSALNNQTLKDFPGAIDLIQTKPNLLKLDWVNKQTAIMLMTHSYAKDFEYLLALKNLKPCYIGVLGPKDRREKLLNNFIENYPEISEQFLNNIYGPAGLNIGSETAQEIALSICAEILAITRKRVPDFLKNRKISIHSNES